MSFSNDANGVSVLDYNQRTSVLVSHFLYGLKDGIVRANCKNIMPFFIQQLADRHRNSPPFEKRPFPAGRLLVRLRQTLGHAAFKLRAMQNLNYYYWLSLI
jgi:hypothetical protein